MMDFCFRELVFMKGDGSLCRFSNNNIMYFVCKCACVCIYLFKGFNIYFF